jgi:predicted DNA-binding ribbon-helix-helix protein
MMKSLIVKRSIVFAGRKTSVSLEDAFWDGLREIARLRRTTLSELVELIDACKRGTNLCSAIRLFVLGAYRDGLVPSARHRSGTAGWHNDRQAAPGP